MKLTALFLLTCVATLALASPAPAQVVRLPTAQTAIVGRFAQGPIDLPLLVDAADFATWFSSGNPSSWPAEIQARQFFANGGSKLYVVRVAGDGLLRDALLGRADELTGLHALEPLSDLRILIAPELSLLSTADFPGAFATLRAFAEPRRIFFILDPPASLATATAAINWVNTTLPDAASFCAIYYPYLQITLDGTSLTAPPSGAIAAIYAKSDNTGGIWKSPAGTSFPLQATNTTPVITSTDSTNLSNAGLNPIRVITGTGIVPFGSRTLDRSSSSTRYLAIVRTQSWIAACLQRALAFAAITDNAEPLWSQIRTLSGNFLQSLYSDGAFQGTTPSQAYYVRCDAATTSASDIAAHRVNLLYGLAMLQASEFDLTQLAAATYDSARSIPKPLLHIRVFANQLFIPYPTTAGFNYSFQQRSTLSATWTEQSSTYGNEAWLDANMSLPAAHNFYRVVVNPAR